MMNNIGIVVKDPSRTNYRIPPEYATDYSVHIPTNIFDKIKVEPEKIEVPILSKKEYRVIERKFIMDEFNSLMDNEEQP